MKTQYIVEARHKNGALNTKYYNPDNPKEFITGITENNLFKYYFKHNKKDDYVSKTWLYKWFNKQGLYIREKTWS